MAPSTSRANGRGKNDESQQASHARIKLAAATERGGRGGNRHDARDESPSDSGDNSHRQLKRARNGGDYKMNGNPRPNGQMASKTGKVATPDHSPPSSKYARQQPTRRKDDVEEDEGGDDYDETQQKFRPMIVKRGGTPPADDEQAEDDDAEQEADFRALNGDGDEGEGEGDQLDADGTNSPAENEDGEDEPESESKAVGKKKEADSSKAGSRKSGRNIQQRSPEASGGNNKKSNQAAKSEDAADGEIDAADAEEEEYTIERVVYHWVDERKPPQFFIKWVGFPNGTWEPQHLVQDTIQYDKYCAQHDITVKSERQIKEEKHAADATEKRTAGKPGRSASGKPKEDASSSGGKRSARRAAGKKVVPEKKPLGKKSVGSGGKSKGAAPRRGTRTSKRTQQVVIATDWAERSRQKIEVEHRKVEQIMGFSPEESVAARELVFGVRFQGEKETHIVSNVMMKKHFPQELLIYYEQLIIASDPTFRKINSGPDGAADGNSGGAKTTLTRTTTGSPSMQTPKLSASKIPMMPTRQMRATSKAE